VSRNQEDPVFNRIEEIRTSLSISRQELAEKTGVHYQTVGYLERGEYNPSLALALKISLALGVSIDEIFSIKPFKKGTK
jgi:DNA-binding XRE family transcriptional regulator